MPEMVARTRMDQGSPTESRGSAKKKWWSEDVGPLGDGHFSGSRYVSGDLHKSRCVSHVAEAQYLPSLAKRSATVAVSQ